MPPRVGPGLQLSADAPTGLSWFFRTPARQAGGRASDFLAWIARTMVIDPIPWGGSGPILNGSGGVGHKSTAYAAPTAQAGAWFRHASYALRSIPPEVLEPVRRQRRLDRGVAQHVRMGLEIEVMVASRCPRRLALAASIRVSTSPGVRCSRVRSSAFGRRVGATVRKTSVGATSLR